MSWRTGGNFKFAALAGRVVVVVAAFAAASLVAAFVATFAVLMEWEEILRSGAGWFMIGFFGLILSAHGLVPAVLVLAIAEALRLRSALFYAALGGAGLVGLYYALGLAETGPGAGILSGRDLEIMAGAGISGGFAYWALAGRNAGRWCERTAAPGA